MCLHWTQIALGTEDTNATATLDVTFHQKTFTDYKTSISGSTKTVCSRLIWVQCFAACWRLSSISRAVTTKWQITLCIILKAFKNHNHRTVSPKWWKSCTIKDGMQYSHWDIVLCLQTQVELGTCPRSDVTAIRSGYTTLHLSGGSSSISTSQAQWKTISSLRQNIKGIINMWGVLCTHSMVLDSRIGNQNNWFKHN